MISSIVVRPPFYTLDIRFIIAFLILLTLPQYLHFHPTVIVIVTLHIFILIHYLSNHHIPSF